VTARVLEEARRHPRGEEVVGAGERARRPVDRPERAAISETSRNVAAAFT